MNYAEIKYCDVANGPGVRTSLFVSGCSHHCPGCFNEIAWDFEHNIPIYKNGSPKWITGKEAVLVWAWKALHVQKYIYPIYSWNYGCQLESLIGQTVSEELKQSEAMRYVRQTLTENPYITDVKEVSVSFTNDVLSISCILNTRYGEVKVNA